MTIQVMLMWSSFLLIEMWQFKKVQIKWRRYVDQCCDNNRWQVNFCCSEASIRELSRNLLTMIADLVGMHGFTNCRSLRLSCSVTLPFNLAWKPIKILIREKLIVTASNILINVLPDPRRCYRTCVNLKCKWIKIKLLINWIVNLNSEILIRV